MSPIPPPWLPLKDAAKNLGNGWSIELLKHYAAKGKLTLSLPSGKPFKDSSAWISSMIRGAKGEIRFKPGEGVHQRTGPR